MVLRCSNSPVAALLVAGLLHAAPAAAEIQTKGAEKFPGPNEVSAALAYQIGFPAGAASNFGSPAGFKLQLEYARRLPVTLLGGTLWADGQVNPVFGGSNGVLCYDSLARPTACSYGGGSSLEIGLGVKWQWSPPVNVPLVLEVPVLLAVEALFDRKCGDNGAAFPTVRPGVGLKYFITANWGVGLGLAVAIGAANHTDSICRPYGGYTDLFGAVDVHVGAAYAF